MWVFQCRKRVGKIPGEGSGNLLRYSRLGNPMDRGAWRVIDYVLQRVGHDLLTEKTTTTVLAQGTLFNAL